MADSSVYIEGVAEGAFSEALNGLPPWATESTAWKIQGVLEKQLGIQTKFLAALNKSGGTGSKGFTPKQLQAMSDEITKATKALKDANKEAEKDKKLRKQKADDAKKSLLTINKLKTSGEKLTYVLTGLATIGAKVLAAETQYIKTYDDLYKSGINVLNGNNKTADGFTALNQMVNLTGMRLETVQKSLLKYSTAINAVGFTKFTKTLAASLPGLRELGFNSEEAADLLGSYVESQQGWTDMRGKTETQIATGAQQFADNLNKMSLATGQARQQLLENIKANSKSVDSTLVSAKYGEDAAKKANMFAAQFSNKNIQDMFLRMASASAPELTNVYRDLVKAGMGDIASGLANIAQRSRTEDSAALLKEVATYQTRLTQAMANGASELRDIGAPGAQEAIQTTADLIGEIRSQTTATEGQTRAAIDTKRASSGLQSELERTAAATQAAFSPMIGQVDLATSALNTFNKALYGAIGAVDADTRSWIAMGAIVLGFGSTLAGLVAKIGRFASLFGSGSAAGGGVAGGSGTAAGGAAAAGTGIGLSVAGAVALPVAIAAGGAYLQHQMNTPEGRKKRADEQKKRLDEKKEILKSYKEGGASAKAIKQVEDEIATHEKLLMELNVDRSKIASQIPTAAKTPAGTTIASPSAIDDAKKIKDAAETGKNTISSPSVVNAPPPSNSDINSQMAYQSSVLEQILLGTTSLVSVNKDILKYTKIAS